MDLKKGYIIIVFLLVCLLSAGRANAQQYGYNEDEYDGSYDYEDESAYAQYYRSTTGKQSGQDRYKSAEREEDLYNGGYRKNLKAEETWKPDAWNSTAFPSKKQNARDVPRQEVENREGPKAWSNTTVDGKNNNNNPGMFNPDGTASGNNTDDGKGNANGDGGDNQFGPPPPPDEPDVPVDTAIPLLIAGGIAIASCRFYIKKSGSY